jgi:hypothetical protein
MKTIAALPLALVVAVACSGDKIEGPSGPTETVSFQMCEDFRPNWMAIQNEGDVWKAITVPATGPVTFDATEKVSVAMALSFFGFGGFTTVFNVTREELSGTVAFLDCDGLAFGDRELNGTVSGLVGDNYAEISAAALTTTAGGSLAWSLTELPNKSMDLVAARVSDAFLRTMDRVIVRRGILPGPPGSAPIPVLNFAGAEAQPPADATLTLSNVGSDVVSVSNTFLTANGTTHSLTNSFSPGTVHPFQSIPPALTIAGDLHELDATASTTEGFREVTHYFRTAANKALTFGAPVGSPTVTTITSGPPKRMRAQLASQTDYPTGVAVTFSQSTNCGETCFTVYVVGVLTTAAFLGGTPATWDVIIPDMSAAGYQASWGLQNNATLVDWDVTAIGGNSSAVLGAPIDGAIVVSATRSSASDFGVASASRSSRVTRRPFVGGFARRR